MDKKVYIAPVAECVLIAPAENIADSTFPWTWQWGPWAIENASIQATGQIWTAPWQYDTTSDPYYSD